MLLQVFAQGVNTKVAVNDVLRCAQLFYSLWMITMLLSHIGLSARGRSSLRSYMGYSFMAYLSHCILARRNANDTLGTVFKVCVSARAQRHIDIHACGALVCTHTDVSVTVAYMKHWKKLGNRVLQAYPPRYTEMKFPQSFSHTKRKEEPQYVTGSVAAGLYVLRI